MPNASTLDTATRLKGAGISVIPINTDGTKAPAGKLLPLDEDNPQHTTWRHYQERLATDKELAFWFGKHKPGIAIVAGAVSGNLEILDFDDPSTLKPWFDLVETVAPGLISRLVIVKTPADGRHVYYRCATIAGNQKLAVSAARHTMIETRGEGGYALIPPSPAKCHPDHKPYVLRQGDLAHIPIISEEERNILLNCARALTQYVEPERVYKPRHPTSNDGTRPGDLFAAQVDWADILMPHGWTITYQRGEVTHWRRPGKTDRGFSATTGYCGDLLYVFSSNAPPFEPERAYSKFTAFALLNTGGDFFKAATMLACQGYINRHAGELAGYQGYQRYRVYRGYQSAKGAVSHG